MRLRVPIAAAGIALLLFGVFRLLTEIPADALVVLAIWLVVAIAIHDGILSPLVVALGAALARWVPDRGRRYLQFALIVIGLVAVIALPLWYREDTQPPVEALLLQNYLGNFALLVGIVATISLVAYALRVARRSDETAEGT